MVKTLVLILHTSFMYANTITTSRRLLNDIGDIIQPCDAIMLYTLIAFMHVLQQPNSLTIITQE